MYYVVLMFAALLGAMVYRYDKYQKSPWYLLLTAVVLGVVAGWLIGFAEDAVLRNAGEIGARFGFQALTAAVMEEGVKLLCVGLLSVGVVRHFKDPMDGLVYGSFIGLGFALIEFVVYQSVDLTNVGLQMNALGGEVIRFVFHLLTGGLCGYGAGLAKFNLPRGRMITCGCTMATITIHYLWDALCGLPSQNIESWFFQRSVAIGLVVTLMFMYGVAVSGALKESQKFYPSHAPVTLWGWPFSLWIKQTN